MTSQREDKPVIAVLCGNAMEFDRFVYERKQLGMDEVYVNINTPRKLQGARFDSVDVVGTFMDRPDAQELYEHARMKTAPPSFDWKKYYSSVTIQESPVRHKTADEKYNEWARKNPVIPTMPNDPDFRTKPSVAPSDRHLGERRDHRFDSLRAWQDSKPLTAPPLQEEKDQSLTETYIQMQRNTEDDANLKRSMKILYPERSEDAAD
jgi:hypothetical protein